MKRIFRHILAGMLVLSLGFWGGTVAIGASAGQGAQATGALGGTLKDPNGRVIKGLHLPMSATNVASGKVYSGITAVDGHYAVNDLPAGSYDISLPIPGTLYHSYDQKGIAISAGQMVTVDLAIKWGSAIGEIGNDPFLFSNDLLNQSHYVDGPAPRTADGHPDLTGEWAPLPKNGGGGAPPMQPWAKAINLKLQAAERPQKDGGPGNGGSAADCLPHDATPEKTAHVFEFTQTPTRLIQLIAEETPVAREIYLDGRKHPNPDVSNPSYYGHSVAHWEGDTLVVDTVGFNDVTPGYGVHTEALHVVERITRPTLGRLVIDITATDPKAWTGPYHTHAEDGLVTGDEISEWVCFRNDPHFRGDWLTLVQKLMATAPASALSDDSAGQESKP